LINKEVDFINTAIFVAGQHLKVMRKAAIILFVLLLLMSCNNQKKQAKQYYQKVNELQSMVIDSETKLQNQMVNVIEMQIDDNKKMYNDTSDIYLQKEVDTLHANYDQLISNIRLAQDSLRKMEGMKKFPTLSNASKDFFKSYMEVAQNEYNMLLQLIVLPDSAYTKQKHKAYLNTTKQLNQRLDKTIKEFNEEMNQYSEKQGVSID